MKKEKKKGHESPQGRWGMGSKEPIRKYFLLSEVKIPEKKYDSSWFLYRMKPRPYKVQKLKITVKKGDHWGGSGWPQKHFRIEAPPLFCYTC